MDSRVRTDEQRPLNNLLGPDISIQIEIGIAIGIGMIWDSSSGSSNCWLSLIDFDPDFDLERHTEAIPAMEGSLGDAELSSRSKSLSKSGSESKSESRRAF